MADAFVFSTISFFRRTSIYRFPVPEVRVAQIPANVLGFDMCFW
jgi:hypothetical protein